MREPDSTASRFDRRASSYEDSLLQQFLFIPVQQTALRLALQLLPQARRVLDVGCGTGQLLRHTRPCYPTAELVGVDLAGQMVATATTVTPTKLAIRYVHGRAECLPFTDDVFDLVFTTLSLRHWRDLSAGIAEIGRVLTPGGLLVVADVFPSCRRRGPALPVLRRHATVPAELGAVLTPTTWPSSAATRPVGSACPTSKSSQHASHIKRAPICPHNRSRPTSLRRCAARHPARPDVGAAGGRGWGASHWAQANHEAAVAALPARWLHRCQGSRRPDGGRKGYRFRASPECLMLQPYAAEQ